MKTQYNKEAHRVFSLIYHLIFVVKYRQKVFKENVGIIEDFKSKCIEISKDFEVSVIEQDCGIDHVHILISCKPTLDITKYINILKGHSSRYLRDKYKEFLKNKLWGDSFWSPSYFIATTGNVSIDILKEYVENQREKLKNED